MKIIEKEIIELLTKRSETVATAESCTGGFLAHRLTNISGASVVIKAGWVSYSDDAKVALLGISADLIERYGAVSEEVAVLMAEAAQRIAGTTFGLSTTGIAGPTGGSTKKPLGTIFMALAEENKETKVWKEFFPSERVTFKTVATEALLQKLLERLKAYTISIK